MKSKDYRIVILLLLVISMAMGFSFSDRTDLSKYKLDGIEMCYNVPNYFDALKANEPKLSYNLFLGKTFIGFKEALGFKESSGNYEIINKYGYLGKYQFAKSTLKLIGIYDSDEFLTDTHLQEKAFAAYTSRNKWILRREIKRYRGRYMNGVKITESGILAAAHLAGAGNVKKYLRSGGALGFADANGTTIQYYMKRFSGYDTSHIVADIKAKVL